MSARRLLHLHRGAGAGRSVGRALGGRAQRSVRGASRDVRQRRAEARATWCRSREGEMLGAWALTEADVGQRRRRACGPTARRDGDGWVLTGRSSSSRTAAIGGTIVVMAVTDRDAGPPRHLGVRRRARHAGAQSAGKKENKLGMRASDTSEVIFEDCRVPADALVGVEGEGFVNTLQVLDAGRIGIAALAVGLAQGAYEAARALRARTPPVRPADRALSGDSLEAGRHGHADRGRAAADLSRRVDARQRARADVDRVVDRQALRERDRRARRRRVRPDSRRLRVREGLSRPRSSSATSSSARSAKARARFSGSSSRGSSSASDGRRDRRHRVARRSRARARPARDRARDLAASRTSRPSGADARRPHPSADRPRVPRRRHRPARRRARARSSTGSSPSSARRADASACSPSIRRVRSAAAPSSAIASACRRTPKTRACSSAAWRRAGISAAWRARRPRPRVVLDAAGLRHRHHRDRRRRTGRSGHRPHRRRVGRHRWCPAPATRCRRSRPASWRSPTSSSSTRPIAKAPIGRRRRSKRCCRSITGRRARGGRRCCERSRRPAPACRSSSQTIERFRARRRRARRATPGARRVAAARDARPPFMQHVERTCWRPASSTRCWIGSRAARSIRTARPRRSRTALGPGAGPAAIARSRRASPCRTRRARRAVRATVRPATGAPEDVGPHRLRFVETGGATLELVEPLSRRLADREVPATRAAPGLHHVCLRVRRPRRRRSPRSRRAACGSIDETPRPGAHGSRIAFVHPSSTGGVLDRARRNERRRHDASVTSSVDCSLSDGTFRLDGGAMFGVVPKPLWERRAPADERNRIPLGAASAARPHGGRTRPHRRRHRRQDERERDVDIYAIDRRQHLDHSLAAAGLTAGDIDVVIASHLHFDHVGGFTTRAATAGCVPRFPTRDATSSGAAEWEDATHPHERNRASYLAENFVPLAGGRRRRLHRRRRRGPAGHQRLAHRRPHDASPDRPDRVGRPDGGLRRGSDADDGARRRALDHGLRPVSDGHAGVQEALRARGDRPRVRYLLRARSGGRGRHHPRARTAGRSSSRSGRPDHESTRDVFTPFRSASSAAAACTTWPS